MELNEFENRVKQTILRKPPIKDELRDFINSSKILNYPYSEVAKKLNNLSNTNEVAQIIREGCNKLCVILQKT